MKRTWELTENPKNKRWYVHISAAAEAGTFPALHEIRGKAAEKGIDPHSLLSDQAIEKSLQKAMDAAGEDYSFPVVIDPAFDVRLIVAPDKTSAWLYLRKSADKKTPIDIKLVSTLINNSKLKGMNAAKINETINGFRTSPSMELHDFLLAEGVHPGRGKDRELISCVEWLSAEETAAMCEKITSFLKQAAASEADKAGLHCTASRIAHIKKGDLAYGFSPAEPGTPGMDVYGKEIPGLPGNDPFFQIVGNLTLGAAGIKADKTGLLVEVEAEGTPQIRIIPYLDGIATPIVSPDNQTVTLILEKEDGAGLPLSAEMALASLEAKGIKGDIDRELIGSTVAQVRKTGKSAEIVVLRAQKPIPPGANRIDWFVRFASEINICNITAGEKILSVRKVPAGSDGVDVFGVKLPASGAKAESTPVHDETVQEETKDSAQIFTAGVSGELSLAENRLSISDKKEITGDVDETSGDIAFPGNLVLTGNIQNGRIVKAAGDLTIIGNAEASLVSADLSVTMEGGIKGAGRGTVWAKQTIRLTFAENARLLAGHDISVDNYCFQCTVKTNGMHLMKGNPAVLLGGTIRASKGIEVYELGSKKTIRTSISFGQNYLVSDQIEVCDKEVKSIEEMVRKIDAEMKKTPPTEPRIHELRKKKLELLKRNEKLTVRIFTLKEQFETHIISHIKVDNTVYPGVILESHGRYYEVREPKTHVIFIFDQTTGQITCSPIED